MSDPTTPTPFETSHPDAVTFGNWAAAPVADGPRPDGSVPWSLCHVPSGAIVTGWAAPKDVAVEAARLMAEALPDIRVDPAMTPEERSAASATWARIWPGVKDAAQRLRPPVVARPYLVTVRRQTSVLVFAEDEDQAQLAVDSIGRPTLERWLSSEELIVEGPERAVAYAAPGEVGAEWSVRPDHANVENYLWAYGGRAYRPDECPAGLYLAAEPRDHAPDCPVRPRQSALGDVEPGPCACDVRVFPPPPPDREDGP